MAFRMKFKGAQTQQPHNPTRTEDINSIRKMASVLEKQPQQPILDNPYQDYRVVQPKSVQPLPTSTLKTFFVQSEKQLDKIPVSYIAFPFDGEHFKLREILLYGTFPKDTRIQLVQESENVVGESLILKDTKVFKWSLDYLFSVPTSLTVLEVKIYPDEKPDEDEKTVLHSIEVTMLQK